MLFNSYEFLYLFMPITLIGFFALSKAQWFRVAAAWLALASVFFYGYWNPRFVALLLGSIAFNYIAGRAILRAHAEQHAGRAKAILVVALVANLGTLCYFKYANFFVNSINAVAHSNLVLHQIVLPIGISFFTFTQIAFLVDTYLRKVHESRLVHYALFVTFFPHLIAGPVLHHAEMMPQFAHHETYRFRLDNFLVGCGFLAIGLFKKVVLADGIQPFVGPVFEADPGYALTALEAWGGVLAYTLQLYFDFSGYSDMAIGLSKMINIDLPLNFNSPYKAVNIAEFWRRWHMTLSRFLRDYLYIPLGGNRHGALRRYMNLLITMVLGGLWHGAGWTFVVWGALHGLYLMVHQLWLLVRRKVFGHDLDHTTTVGSALSVGVTFLSAVIAWVFFRATSIDSAWRVLQGMAAVHGLITPGDWASLLSGGPPIDTARLDAFGGLRQWVWIALLLLLVWCCPNSQELVAKVRASRWVALRPHWGWMSLGGCSVAIFLLAAINGSHGASEFIYFNF
jgi:D-alanyl-lipoteichoic acid acyltransferase DltB (MBOAT superfamily)